MRERERSRSHQRQRNPADRWIRLVDIYYDVSASGNVSVGGYMDYYVGSTLCSIELLTMSGDWGSNVQPGTGKHIVWNSGVDAPWISGTDFRVDVSATLMGFGGYAYSGYFSLDNSTMPRWLT